MAVGPAPLGFAYFAAIKYVGYTSYCRFVIQRRAKAEMPDRPVLSAWIAGAIRTGIGVTIGAAVGLSFWKIPFMNKIGDWATLLFFIFLVPVRIAEWWLLIRLAYRSLLGSVELRNLIGGGILASFALDAIGIFCAFALPGGMWVC